MFAIGANLCAVWLPIVSLSVVSMSTVDRGPGRPICNYGCMYYLNESVGDNDDDNLARSCIEVGGPSVVDSV